AIIVIVILSLNVTPASFKKEPFTATKTVVKLPIKPAVKSDFHGLLLMLTFFLFKNIYYTVLSNFRIQLIQEAFIILLRKSHSPSQVKIQDIRPDMTFTIKNGNILTCIINLL